MKNSTDYLYVRQLYSNQYYAKEGIIEITLVNGEKRYLYFDKEKHMKYTDKKQYASRFYKKPKNYEIYVERIKKVFNGAVVNYIEKVVVKNKY